MELNLIVIRREEEVEESAKHNFASLGLNFRKAEYPLSFFLPLSR